MSDLEFINEYRNMLKISDLCNEYNINQSNLIYGKSSKENEKLVASRLKLEIERIYAEILLDRRF